MLSFFPRGVLDEILNLIESVSEDFPSYFWNGKTEKSFFSGKVVLFDIKMHLNSTNDIQEVKVIMRPWPKTICL